MRALILSLALLLGITSAAHAQLAAAPTVYSVPSCPNVGGICTYSFAGNSYQLYTVNGQLNNGPNSLGTYNPGSFQAATSVTAPTLNAYQFNVQRGGCTWADTTASSCWYKIMGGDNLKRSELGAYIPTSGTCPIGGPQSGTCYPYFQPYFLSDAFRMAAGSYPINGPSSSGGLWFIARQEHGPVDSGCAGESPIVDYDLYNNAGADGLQMQYRYSASPCPEVSQTTTATGALTSNLTRGTWHTRQAEIQVDPENTHGGGILRVWLDGGTQTSFTASVAPGSSTFSATFSDNTATKTNSTGSTCTGGSPPAACSITVHNGLMTVTGSTPGTIKVGGLLTAAGLVGPVQVTSQVSGTTGGDGVYTTGLPQTLGPVSTTETYGVVSVTVGSPAVGDIIFGGNLGAPGLIQSGSGSTFYISNSQTASSAAMTRATPQVNYTGNLGIYTTVQSLYDKFGLYADDDGTNGSWTGQYSNVEIGNATNPAALASRVAAPLPNYH